MRFRVFEHSPDLGVQIPAQGLAIRLSEQFVVGHRTPQEIRKSRGERVVVNRSDWLAVLQLYLRFATEQEMGRDQYRFQCHLQASLKILAPIPGRPEQPHKPIDFFRSDRPPKSALGEGTDNPSSARRLS